MNVLRVPLCTLIAIPRIMNICVVVVQVEIVACEHVVDYSNYDTGL